MPPTDNKLPTPRVPNIMKRACVASQNRRKREARRSQYSLYWQALRQRSRGGRSRFQAVCAWMRPRSGTGARQYPRSCARLRGRIPGNRGPCSTLRRAGDSGRNPLGLARFWPAAMGSVHDRCGACPCRLSRVAKTVTAQRVFHCVRRSKPCRPVVRGSTTGLSPAAAVVLPQ